MTFLLIWFNPITTYAFLIVIKHQLSPHINHKNATFLLLADYISLGAPKIDISKLKSDNTSKKDM
jgi:hypothetical protein